MEDMHISLIFAALAAVTVQWLAWRCIRLRVNGKILHGDGANPLLARRMRAQANFIEYTPIAIILVILLDITRQDGWLLAMSALLFILGRVLHAAGMDADRVTKTRQTGMAITLFLLPFWAIWALLVAFRMV